jgi:DNA helicase HerA-like ATPase
MHDYEKLGSFYLGKLFDSGTNQLTDNLLMYDAKDLTTHAVCVGMTGSGKTGLCISLLEEAAIDGIPAIVIDPKGDLGNLLLTFPELRPSDFEPWLEESDAARKGLTLPQLAEKTAETWRKGLTDWHQPIDRIARLKQAAEVSIYTPGSTAGRPLTVLRSFDAPSQEIIDDTSSFRDYIMSAVSGLLALVGVEGDPLRSREHILLSSIMDHYWRLGQNLDIPALIHAIQKPPFNKVGVFDLDSFYPANDRLGLAMSLNNLIASPGFSVWTQGEPLDVQRLMYTQEGKPRLTILSIAHLSDSERMFFVTILLNAVLAWMRTQSGTSSLRALLYMDEIFGYFPPSANPPSKLPMLTLLKQARAFGLGVVLATQNPVDLDYKGLSNTGTWLIGRLQTDRDKGRVLDGLESAAQGSGAGFSRSEMDKLLSGLGNRVFLLHNVHQPHPVLFQTRWVMSFLRGPLTLSQIKKLSGDSAAPAAAPVAPLPSFASTATQNAVPSEVVADMPVSAPMAGTRPTAPPGVEEFFLRPKQAGATVSRYKPGIVAQARLHFVDAKSKTDCWQSIQFLHHAVERAEEMDWNQADFHMGTLDGLDRQPLAGAGFDSIPDAVARPANFKMWSKMLESHIYQATTLDLHRCPELKIVSKPGQTEGDFKANMSTAAHERRDAEMEKVRKKYATKIVNLQEQIRKAGARVEKEKDQLGQQKMNTAISFGTTLLGALLGRRAMTASTMGRAASTIKGAGRASKEKRDIEMANDTLAALEQRLEDQQQQLESELETIKRNLDIEAMTVETLHIRPRKSDISITSFGLVWLPVG